MTFKLKDRYQETVKRELIERFAYKNVNEVPRLEKVVLNMSVGEAIQNSKALDAAVKDLTVISGQKPIITKAKKSIAAFKLREGMNIGAKVTLRGERMYSFLEKFFFVVTPRMRDFRGLKPHAFDGHGNYSVGLTEQYTFPEIDFDKTDKARGLDITIVTTAKTDEEAREFLLRMGLPLKKGNA
jgi:large subunit ribosomal protein L5